MRAVRRAVVFAAFVVALAAQAPATALAGDRPAGLCGVEPSDPFVRDAPPAFVVPAGGKAEFRFSDG